MANHCVIMVLLAITTWMTIVLGELEAIEVDKSFGENNFYLLGLSVANLTLSLRQASLLSFAANETPFWKCGLNNLVPYENVILNILKHGYTNNQFLRCYSNTTAFSGRWLWLPIVTMRCFMAGDYSHLIS